ncbi:hypothetical protein, partial [Paraburkholderia sediminicola]|uniref:hypothetical protein n=1 Tax=Paraburkholderia sediminicola TaxID=458836 RepID=UPI0038BD9EAC
ADALQECRDATASHGVEYGVRENAQMVPGSTRRRAQRRRKHDGLVTEAECARTQIPDAPLPPPSQGTRLRISGVSCFLLLTSLCSGKEK